MRTNTAATNRARTHEGAAALPKESRLSELRRAVLACLLYEDTFYERGSKLATRIESLALDCESSAVAALAVEARRKHGLRHVSLFLALTLVGRGLSGASRTVSEVVQRPDELAEMVALYWRDGKRRLPPSLKRGLAHAFTRFNAERFAKYDREAVIKLRDVLFMVHAKPRDDEQAATFKALAARTLAAPDTWEVALSSGADKRATWTRLLTEKRLGALALLRNLRNMESAGVDRNLILSALFECEPRGVLPWQVIGAAVHAPWAESALESMMFRAALGRRLAGETWLLVDVSGSMYNRLSGRGERTRMDAACSLTMVAREMCERVRVFTFSEMLVEVAPRRGFALAEQIQRSQARSSTYLAAAMKALPDGAYDRLIVLTDEQTHDNPAHVNISAERGYMVNVGPYAPALAMGGKWERIAGWSDRLLDYIIAVESETPSVAL